MSKGDRQTEIVRDRNRERKRKDNNAYTCKHTFLYFPSFKLTSLFLNRHTHSLTHLLTYSFTHSILLFSYSTCTYIFIHSHLCMTLSLVHLLVSLLVRVSVRMKYVFIEMSENMIITHSVDKIQFSTIRKH